LLVYTAFQKRDAKIQNILSELIILLAASIIAFLAQTLQILTKFTAWFLSNSFSKQEAPLPRRAQRVRRAVWCTL